MFCQDFFEQDNHPVPFCSRDVQVGVRFFHTTPAVLARTAGGLAHHTRHVILEVWCGDTLPRGMGVENLGKTESAIQELTDKGMAPE